MRPTRRHRELGKNSTIRSKITDAEPNPRDGSTYNPAPTLWRYDAQTNILWLKLPDASSNTSWFPIQLDQFPQSVDYTGAA